MTPLKDRAISARLRLLEIYSLLYKKYGPRKWWPADTDFEVIVGAILTQNTNWSNVEKAISNLKEAGLLNPQQLRKVSLGRLATSIKPSGYFNQKAKRLKVFLKYFYKNYKGRVALMKKTPLSVLRKELLEINGIGPETADSILLYALDKPTFVIDSYTKRLFNCLFITERDNSYHDMQDFFMENLPKKQKLFNEYHALRVTHAQEVCKKKPHCNKCILHSLKVKKQ